MIQLLSDREYLYKGILKWIALNEPVFSHDVYEEFSEEKNNGSGWREPYIRSVLKKLSDQKYLHRWEYEVDKVGRNPYAYRTTKTGKKTAVQLWDELRYLDKKDKVIEVA